VSEAGVSMRGREGEVPCLLSHRVAVERLRHSTATIFHDVKGPSSLQLLTSLALCRSRDLAAIFLAAQRNISCR